MESTSYVLSFRMVFFYLVTTGWIFYNSLLCEDSINQSNQYKGELQTPQALLISTIISSEFPPRGDAYFFRKAITLGVTQRCREGS